MMIPHDRRLGTFLFLTFLLSWPFWIVSGVLSGGDAGFYDFRWLVAQVGVFAPSLAALIVSADFRKDLRRNNLRILPLLLFPLALPGILIAASAPAQVFEFPLLPSILTVLVAAAIILFFSPLNRRLLNPGTGEKHEKPPARWIFLSIFFFPGLFLLAWLIVNLPGKTWELSAFQGSGGGFAWILLISFAHNFLLGGPLGEELGWRGFLLPELLKRRSPLTASLFLGVIWALWHLPVDLSGGFLLPGPAAIMVRFIWTLPVAILFTWFYLNSGGNLLVVLFLHTSINVLSDPGFSKYELSLLLFFILMAISAIVVSVSSRVFRRAS